MSETEYADRLRQEAERHLRALVGSDDATLREDQWSAIESLVAQRRRALVVQRTGWGKSAVYFVATLLLRAAGAGPTVIVSPLLALMRNQIQAAERAGIRAVTINSANLEQWEEVHAQIAAGEVDVLLVSPERLNNPSFRDEVLPRLAATCGLLVIDEAHCISDWGHDFRPDYRRLRTLMGELPEGIPVLATTATANARVTDDVSEQMGADTLVLRGALDRDSLRLGVVQIPSPQHRLAWLADNLGRLPGSGIVYCLTVSATQDVARHLSEAGHAVAAYSGQTEASERQALEAALLSGELKALVATSALGMGFDATLGFVINLGAPPSPVAYYQQIGRAGRGTDEAQVLLMPQPEDKEIWAYFASLAFPSEAQVRRTLSALETAGGAISTAMLETEVDLGRTRLETMLKVLDVDGAVRRVRGGWESTGQPWDYDADRFARVQATREREQQAMLDYASTSTCRMRFLREQLDDPVSEDCGRCDNCGGLATDTTISAESEEAAARALGRPGVVIEPRKLWPSGLDRLGVPLKGRIAASEPGRAVARLTDLGLGADVRALFREGAGDCAVPAPLAAGLMEVMREWAPEWGERPSAIVHVESATRPSLTRDLAEGLSRVMQLPIVGTYAVVDPSVPPGAGAANSAHRIAAVTKRHALRGDVPSSGVLLVDDLVVTGWTLTCAAHALREAGATSVLPVALATQR